MVACVLKNIICLIFQVFKELSEIQNYSYIILKIYSGTLLDNQHVPKTR